jgi:hypothetical protein
MMTARGDTVWLRSLIRMVAGQAQTNELVGVMVDISERKRQSKQQPGSKMNSWTT